MKIRIAEDLALPLDFTTQTAAIVAKRRAGKSYLSRRIAEQLFKAGQQIVIVDPKGDWWGIRSAADGKSAGLPIVTLGGERGDAPLEVSAGEVVARLVVEERVSALLDLSLFRKRDVATFMTAFLEALYRLKAREQYRTPLMLITDEADAIAPQRPMEGEERMLGAMEDIVRRGGQRGIGCMLITQRTAVLNKNVLTQAEVLVALRTIAPQDLAAMNAWIDVHGTVEGRRELMDSLPSLPIGEAWVWSPGWPTANGIFQRVHVLPIETFDSGATPKPGEKRREPKQLADVDLDALRRQMSESIERAAQNDPKQIRKKYETRIAELEKQLKAKPAAALPDVTRFKADVDRWRGVAESAASENKRLVAAQKRIGRLFASLFKINEQIASELLLESAKVDQAASITQLVERTVSQPRIERPRPVKTTPVRENREADDEGFSVAGSLGSGERKVLIAIAQHSDGVTREQLSVLTDYKKSSRDTYLKKLAARNLIGRNDAGNFVVTDEGLAELGDSFEPLPTGDMLREHWLATLPAGERAVLEIVTEKYPDTVPRDDISDVTNYKKSSRDTFIKKLAARRIVTVTRDGIRASDLLFG